MCLTLHASPMNDMKHTTSMAKNCRILFVPETPQFLLDSPHEKGFTCFVWTECDISLHFFHRKWHKVIQPSLSNISSSTSWMMNGNGTFLDILDGGGTKGMRFLDDATFRTNDLLTSSEGIEGIVCLLLHSGLMVTVSHFGYYRIMIVSYDKRGGS